MNPRAARLLDMPPTVAGLSCDDYARTRIEFWLQHRYFPEEELPVSENTSETPDAEAIRLCGEAGRHVWPPCLDSPHAQQLLTDLAAHVRRLLAEKGDVTLAVGPTVIGAEEGCLYLAAAVDQIVSNAVRYALEAERAKVAALEGAVARLREAMEGVLTAWTTEANWGDGIDQRHAAALDKARAVLAEADPCQ